LNNLKKHSKIENKIKIKKLGFPFYYFLSIFVYMKKEKFILILLGVFNIFYITINIV
jgi:hypothetical protein